MRKKSRRFLRAASKYKINEARMRKKVINNSWNSAQRLKNLVLIFQKLKTRRFPKRVLSAFYMKY